VSKDPAATPDSLSPTELRQLFQRYGFRPRRALGQTFLIDANTVRRIVASAELTGDEPVLEVGAGAGAVTRGLMTAARRVIAVEIDPTLVAILRETVGERVQVVQADLLEVDWAGLFGPEDKGRWRVVANLPYAITGPALFRLSETREWAERLVIMVQAEVARRLAAPPASRARGILSVLLQVLFDVNVAAGVPRTCFWPRPRVDSTILTLNVRRPSLLPRALEPAFRRVIRGAFGTRRKTLANALAGSPEVAVSKADALAILSHCGVDHSRRAESLTEQEFLRLAEAIARHQGKLSE
jgi:16S rRNA (adenine1518-N6/adenine1519-N6)-dimethyltransferase